MVILSNRSIQRLIDALSTNIHRKEELYTSGRGDSDEFRRMWQEYSLSSLDLLNTLAQISELLFMRFNDEFRRDKDRIIEEGELSLINKKIENIINFHTDIATLYHQYTIFAFPESLRDSLLVNNTDQSCTEHMIASETHMSFGSSQFFNKDIPMELLEGISEFSRNRIKSVEGRQKIHMLNLDQNGKEKFAGILGEAYEDHANFFYDSISERIESIAQSWWWDDPLLQSSVYRHAQHYYSEAIRLRRPQNLTKEEQSRLDKYNLLNIPICESKHFLSEIKLFYDMGITNIIYGLHRHGSKHFSYVVEKADNFKQLLRSHPSLKSRNVYYEFDSFIKKVRLIRLIASLAGYLNTISRLVLSQKLDEIMPVIDQLIKEKTDFEYQIDIPIISSLPEIFESIAQTLKLRIELENRGEDLITVIQYQLNNFHDRIKVAIKTLEGKWQDITKIKNWREKIHLLREYLTETELLIEAIGLIPIAVLEKEETYKRLEILYNLAKSIYWDYHSFQIDEENPLLGLVHKISASYYAKVAFDGSRDGRALDLPRDRIMSQYYGTYIFTRTQELSIFKLILQYLLINDILPKISLSITQSAELVEDAPGSLKSLQDSFRSEQMFQSIFDAIEKDSEEMIDFQEHFKVRLKEISWNSIKRSHVLITGSKIFYESVQQMIFAHWATQVKLFDEAMVFVRKSRELAFNASNILSREGNKSLEDFSKHVYSFGLLSQDIETAIERKEEFSIPISNIIKLIKDLIFAI